jgi:hypothetical protein
MGRLYKRRYTSILTAWPSFMYLGSMTIERRLQVGINVSPWAMKSLFFSSLTSHCLHFTRLRVLHPAPVSFLTTMPLFAQPVKFMVLILTVNFSENLT